MTNSKMANPMTLEGKELVGGVGEGALLHAGVPKQISQVSSGKKKVSG